MSTPCLSTQQLRGFARATRFSATDSAALESHLMECHACASKLESSTLDLLESLVASEASTRPISAESEEGSKTQVFCGRPIFSSLGPLPTAFETLLHSLEPAKSANGMGCFAGFELLELVGIGGMGCVFKARDLTLDRVVALKWIHPGNPDSPSFCHRWLDEARAVAALHSEHIVPIHHAGVEKGFPYLVMPFYEHGTLANPVFGETQMTPAALTRIGYQLASALETLHRKGLLHCDLKPSNVLLETKSDNDAIRVRLADFGLARATSETDRTRTLSAEWISGTPAYMSPEQASGKPLDGRSDLFGLGALLFHLATGRTLYAGEETGHLLAEARNGPTLSVDSLVPGFPSELTRIIDQLIHPSPDQRPANAQTVVEVFSQLLKRQNKGSSPLRRLGILAVLFGIGAVLSLCGSEGWKPKNSKISRPAVEAQEPPPFQITGQQKGFRTLREAVQAARNGDTILLQFSGERTSEGFRTGGKALRMQAAVGCSPTLVATNDGQPFVLVEAPFAIEGVAFVRRSSRVAFAPLFTVEGASLHAAHCRFVKAPVQGDPTLIRGGELVSAEETSRADRPLIRVSSDGAVHLSHCIVAGRVGTGIGVLGMKDRLVKLDLDGCLFAIHRAFAFRLDSESSVDLKANQSVFSAKSIFDLEQSTGLKHVQVSWTECRLDWGEGALFQHNSSIVATWKNSLDWRETQVQYRGSGPFLTDRARTTLDREEDWNAFMKIRPSDHSQSREHTFMTSGMRSAQRLNGSDVLTLSPTFNAQLGEGVAYQTAKGSRSYELWRHCSLSEEYGGSPEKQSQDLASSASLRPGMTEALP